MGLKSTEKGKVGEREWRDFLREHGCPDARRGQQFAGGGDSPDVVGGWPGTHAEVKRCEALNLYAAVEQAAMDCGDRVPYIAHRRNGKEWLIVIRAKDVLAFAGAVAEVKK
jgi:Holliday junction resolvase